MSKLIPLTKGKFAVVDDEDFEALSAFRWHAYPDRGTFYARRSDYSEGHVAKTVLMHRQVLGAGKGEQVDHVNGDGLDNTRTNLRFCTPLENARNARRRKDNQSGFKGVVWHKQRKQWVAHIRIDGKLKHLGLFPTKEDAARAYDEVAKRIHKEFANLNYKKGA